jgi:hypothetical protein
VNGESEIENRESGNQIQTRLDEPDTKIPPYRLFGMEVFSDCLVMDSLTLAEFGLEQSDLVCPTISRRYPKAASTPTSCEY